MKKRIIVIVLAFMIVLSLPVSAQVRELEVNITTSIKSTHISPDQAILTSNRYYIPTNKLTEKLGLAVSWDGGEQEITIRQLNGMDVRAKHDNSVWYINDLPYYYLDKSFIIDNKRTFMPIRIILEPVCQVQFTRTEQTDIIQAKENKCFNHVKILTDSSEVIVNYQLHPLTAKLVQRNGEVFVPVREFITLLRGQLEYVETSTYSSPELKIIPANVNQVISLYPQKNQAVLINNDTKEKKQVPLTQKLLQKNGSYYIATHDLIAILQAEEDTYLDSDINTYLNFAF